MRYAYYLKLWYRSLIDVMADYRGIERITCFIVGILIVPFLAFEDYKKDLW